uniref:TRPM SLOG domain-containing protein n=1 Tax=Naja naja TaxID=35670 RepID=A0A8C7DYY2_NAJNA
RKENTQNKMYSNEEKEYCIGEIDFLATRKKQGKVPQNLSWNLPAPNLVVSFVGEEEHFQMKPWLRDTLKKGLVKAAQSTGAWIFTSGLHVGITKHIGQAVQDHMLTSTSSTLKVVAIGITSLEKIQQRDLLDNVEVPFFHWQNHKTDNNVQGPLYSLDHHHSHFILVEENEPGGTTKLQLTLEKYISEQHTNYGGKTQKKRIFRGLNNSIPCLILAGSGGIADILAALMSEPCLIVPEVVEKQLKQKFPTENFTSNETDRWTEMPCDLEEVLMDALVNDKPEFVKLFIDNGANIYEFLTYSRLQTLYYNISSKSLLYKLIFKKHNKEDVFILHEVSRVLKDFLHDACRGFYHDQKPGGKKKVVSVLIQVVFNDEHNTFCGLRTLRHNLNTFRTKKHVMVPLNGILKGTPVEIVLVRP